jgi:hypothetical protein
MKLFKPFVTLPIDSKTGKRRIEPLKPGLDKVYVHSEYTLASNGQIVLKLNEPNDTEEPYLVCPKTNSRYIADEYPIDILLRIIDYDQGIEKIELTHNQVVELINVHMQAKVCRHPSHVTTWGEKGFYAASIDKECTFKYDLPNKSRAFSYSADYMLQILRVVKKYKEGCILYPKTLSPIVFTFGNHQAILMPAKID